MGYVARHWRGELSLPLAFWINNGLLMLPLGLGIAFLMVWIAAWGQSLQLASIALLLGVLLMLLLSVWGTVGAWRSAAAYRDSGGAAGWALAADGRSVTLSGPFGMGVAPRFERLLQAAPQLRQVLLDSPGARLGFHRASVPSLNPLHDELANRRLAALYDEAGLPRDFIARVLAVPAQRMWFPVVEQRQAGIIDDAALRMQQAQQRGLAPEAVALDR